MCKIMCQNSEEISILDLRGLSESLMKVPAVAVV